MLRRPLHLAPLGLLSLAGAAALVGAPRAAEATPLPRLGVELSVRLARAHAGDRPGLGIVPVGLVDAAIRWERGARDALHTAASSLARLADAQGVRIPDVTVLTTEPVADSESSGFGWRDDPLNHRARFHSGTDVRGKRGTPIAAAGDGVVTFAARMGGYGNVIFVDHGGGVETRYAHLQRFRVKLGDAVRAGQTIGAMGATGRTTGPHLHFEVRLEGAPVDPNLALTIARLGREAPTAGRVAAFALAPELQRDRTSAHDPPRAYARRGRHGAPARTGKPASRPDRPGRIKIARPVS